METISKQTQQYCIIHSFVHIVPFSFFQSIYLSIFHISLSSSFPLTIPNHPSLHPKSTILGLQFYSTSSPSICLSSFTSSPTTYEKVPAICIQSSTTAFSPLSSLKSISDQSSFRSSKSSFASTLQNN